LGGIQIGLQGGVGGRVSLGDQRGQARAAQHLAVHAAVFAEVDVANAQAVVEVRVVGVVTEAVVLVFGGVGLQGHLHALARQLAQGQAAHAEQHLAQAVLDRFGLQAGAVVVGARPPLGKHLFQVGDQQVGGGLQVGAATLVVVTGGACAHQEVGMGTLAGAGLGAVQVLAPEQELDAVVSVGLVGVRGGQCVAAGQQLGGDLGDVVVALAAADLGVGDDVGGGARVAQGVLVVLGHVVDQAFVQRPGVDLPLPLIHVRV